jgi:hypothetical protein
MYVVWLVQKFAKWTMTKFRKVSFARNVAQKAQRKSLWNLSPLFVLRRICMQIYTLVWLVTVRVAIMWVKPHMSLQTAGASVVLKTRIMCRHMSMIGLIRTGSALIAKSHVLKTMQWA